MFRYRLDRSIAFGLHAAQQSWSLWRLELRSVSYAVTANLECQDWYYWKEYEHLLPVIDSAELILLCPWKGTNVEYIRESGSVQSEPILCKLPTWSYDPSWHRLPRVGNHLIWHT